MILPFAAHPVIVPVHGRKDIGGIVGQMEPFIEINEAESLRDAVDKLHDLIDKTIDDMLIFPTLLEAFLRVLTALVKLFSAASKSLSTPGVISIT